MRTHPTKPVATDRLVSSGATYPQRIADSLRLTVYGQYRTLDPDLQLEAAGLIDSLLDEVASLMAERGTARRWAAAWKEAAGVHRKAQRVMTDIVVGRETTARRTAYTPLPHVGDAAFVPVEAWRAAFTTTTEAAHGVGV